MPVEINHDMDVKELLRENLKLTQEIHAMTKKIKGHITFQKIVSFIYFVIIVAPIVLGIIFLPPILKDMVGQYQSLLGVEPTAALFDNFFKKDNISSNQEAINPDQKNIDIKKLPPEIQKLLGEY